MIRKFVKAGTWVLASNIGAKVINFLLLNILARFLNPTGFGMYNAIIASSASINQMSDVGSTMVLQRSTAKLSGANMDKIINRFLVIFLVQFTLNLLFTFAIYGFPDFFDRLLFHNSIADKPIQFIGLVALVQIFFQVPMTLILGLGEFRNYAVRMIIANGISLLCTVGVLVIFGVSIRFALLALVSSLFLNGVVSWVMLLRMFRQLQVPMRIKHIESEIVQIFREGFVYYLGNILAGAVFNIALIGLFSKFIGIEEFGYVRIATAMVAIMSIVPTAFQSVNITFLAQSEVNSLQLKSMQLRSISVVCFLISIILICYLNTIIKIFFGAPYLPGREIFIFIILINILIVLSAIITNFLVSQGHGSYVGVISSICVCLNILASFLLIPRLGIRGYYIGQSLGFGIGFILVMFKEFKKYQYPDIKQLKKLAIIILGGLGGITPVLLIPSGIGIEVYKVIYILMMMVLAFPVAINEFERRRVLELIRSNRHSNH